MSYFGTEIQKIDKATTLGLAGTSNSLSYRVHEIEKHFHNFERWFGKSADQTGVNPWATSASTYTAGAMPVSYVATSGNDDYGADANDEALVWGLYDTLSVGGVVQTKLDFHQILFRTASNQTLNILRIVYGSGTLADAITAGQFSEYPVLIDPATGGSVDIVIAIMMPRITIGTHKVWVQNKNASDDSTVGFLVGAHGYVA
jgi:hypothetical protein